MARTAWDDLTATTDGPGISGAVRVSGTLLPFRMMVVNGVPVPIPWDRATEDRFVQWFLPYAKRAGIRQHPDHDSHTRDYRALWWLGYQHHDEQVTMRGQMYAPVRERVDQVLKV